MIMNIVYLSCVEQQVNFQNFEQQNNVNNSITLRVLDKVRAEMQEKIKYIEKSEKQNHIDMQIQEKKLDQLENCVAQLLKKFDENVEKLKLENKDVDGELMNVTRDRVNELCLSQNDCTEQMNSLSNQLISNDNNFGNIIQKIEQIESSSISNQTIQNLYDLLYQYSTMLQNILDQSKNTTKTIQNNDNQIFDANMQSCTIAECLQQQINKEKQQGEQQNKQQSEQLQSQKILQEFQQKQKEQKLLSETLSYNIYLKDLIKNKVNTLPAQSQSYKKNK